MAVTAEKSAPYAPASAIIALIERHRNRGLPAPVTSEVLGRAGISNSLIPRTLQALQVLDLIDEQGAPTETMEGLRLAPEAEYQKRLSEWLKGAYADVLSFVDPAQDDETAVRDAFRSYNPVGQQPRMVSLFLGLLATAGMADEKHKGQSRRSSRSAVGQVARLPVTPAAGKPASQKPPSKKVDADNSGPKQHQTSESALEYRLVDLITEASLKKPEVVPAIIEVITFLKTKDVTAAQPEEES